MPILQSSASLVLFSSVGALLKQCSGGCDQRRRTEERNSFVAHQSSEIHLENEGGRSCAPQSDVSAPVRGGPIPASAVPQPASSTEKGEAVWLLAGVWRQGIRRKKIRQKRIRIRRRRRQRERISRCRKRKRNRWWRKRIRRR